MIPRSRIENVWHHREGVRILCDDEHLRIAQVAERLNVSQTTVHSWIRDGSLSAVDVSGRADAQRKTYVVSVRSLKIFLKNRTLNANSPYSKAND